MKPILAVWLALLTLLCLWLCLEPDSNASCVKHDVPEQVCNWEASDPIAMSSPIAAPANNSLLAIASCK